MAEDLATTLFLEFVGMPPPLIFAPLTGNLLLNGIRIDGPPIPPSPAKPSVDSSKSRKLTQCCLIKERGQCTMLDFTILPKKKIKLVSLFLSLKIFDDFKIPPQLAHCDTSFDLEICFVSLQLVFKISSSLRDSSTKPSILRIFAVRSLNFVEINGQGFCDFMQEMLSMMDNVRGEPDSLEDLQKMFVEMVGGDSMRFDFGAGPTATKRPRGGSTKGHAAAKRTACTTSRC